MRPSNWEQIAREQQDIIETQAAENAGLRLLCRECLDLLSQFTDIAEEEAKLDKMRGEKKWER